MMMVDTTVIQLLLVDETKYNSMPAGLFGKLKALLSFSLNADVFFITAIFFGILDADGSSDDPSVANSSSFVRLGVQCFLAFTFAATLYAHYGLVTMNLSRFIILVVLWTMTIVTSVVFVISLFTSWMIYIYSKHAPSADWDFQAITCSYLGNIDYCKASKNDYFIMISIFAAMVSIFKLAQMICLRVLMAQAVDHANVNSGRSTRPETGNNNRDAAGSDSEDDDVVVFERVFGRYPGGSKIKDASVA